MIHYLQQITIQPILRTIETEVCFPAVREGIKGDERFSSSIISGEVLLHQREMDRFLWLG